MHRYQYFSDSTTGGSLAQADYCPSVQIYSNGACADTSNVPPTNYAGETYGENSQCFQSSVLRSKWVADSSVHPRCHATRCSAGTLELQLSSSDGTHVWVACPAAGATVEGPHGFTGQVTCPTDIALRCNPLACPGMRCEGTNECIAGVCVCGAAFGTVCGGGGDGGGQGGAGNPSPPSTPPLAAAVLTASFLVAGTVADFTLSVQNSMRSKVADAAGVDLGAVTLDVLSANRRLRRLSASARLDFTISLASEADATRALDALDTHMSSASAASALLSSPSMDVDVLTIEQQPRLHFPPAPPTAPPPSPSPPPPTPPAPPMPPAPPSAPASALQSFFNTAIEDALNPSGWDATKDVLLSKLLANVRSALEWPPQTEVVRISGMQKLVSDLARDASDVITAALPINLNRLMASVIGNSSEPVGDLAALQNALSQGFASQLKQAIRSAPKLLKALAGLSPGAPFPLPPGHDFPGVPPVLSGYLGLISPHEDRIDTAVQSSFDRGAFDRLATQVIAALFGNLEAISRAVQRSMNSALGAGMLEELNSTIGSLFTGVSDGDFASVVTESVVDGVSSAISEAGDALSAFPIPGRRLATGSSAFNLASTLGSTLGRAVNSSITTALNTTFGRTMANTLTNNVGIAFARILTSVFDEQLVTLVAVALKDSFGASLLDASRKLLEEEAQNLVDALSSQFPAPASSAEREDMARELSEVAARLLSQAVHLHAETQRGRALLDIPEFPEPYLGELRSSFESLTANVSSQAKEFVTSQVRGAFSGGSLTRMLKGIVNTGLDFALKEHFGNAAGALVAGALGGVLGASATQGIQGCAVTAVVSLISGDGTDTVQSSLLQCAEDLLEDSLNNALPRLGLDFSGHQVIASGQFWEVASRGTIKVVAAPRLTLDVANLAFGLGGKIEADVDTEFSFRVFGSEQVSRPIELLDEPRLLYETVIVAGWIVVPIKVDIMPMIWLEGSVNAELKFTMRVKKWAMLDMFFEASLKKVCAARRRRFRLASVGRAGVGVLTWACASLASQGTFYQEFKFSDTPLTFSHIGVEGYLNASMTAHVGEVACYALLAQSGLAGAFGLRSQCLMRV